MPIINWEGFDSAAGIPPLGGRVWHPLCTPLMNQAAGAPAVARWVHDLLGMFQTTEDPDITVGSAAGNLCESDAFRCF